MRGKPNSFPKKRIIRNKKEIGTVFSKGSALFSYPFQIKFLPSKGKNWTSFLFSVPKKKHPKAVDRNRIKRQIKEIVRLHNDLWREDTDPKLVMITYIAKDKEDFNFLNRKLVSLMKRLFLEDGK